MEISSRTPEGQPNHCPVCDSDVVVESSLLFGDATCSNCGSLLWFFRDEATPIFFDHGPSESFRNRIFAILSNASGRDPIRSGEIAKRLRELNPEADSLDLVELVMEVEDEF